MNDINIGEITEALNNKVDLPTDPARAQDQIDYVVDYQVPTADNNYTWYRKYKSGWVEQGGHITLPSAQSSTTVDVAFPVAMSNTNYTFNATVRANGETAWTVEDNTRNPSTTGTSVSMNYYSNKGTFVGFSWQVCGYAA